jgi:hypothetical protein
MLLGVIAGENNNLIFNSSALFCKSATLEISGKSFTSFWYNNFASSRLPLASSERAWLNKLRADVLLPVKEALLLVLFIPKTAKTPITPITAIIMIKYFLFNLNPSHFFIIW